MLVHAGMYAHALDRVLWRLTAVGCLQCLFLQRSFERPRGLGLRLVIMCLSIWHWVFTCQAASQ